MFPKDPGDDAEHVPPVDPQRSSAHDSNFQIANLQGAPSFGNVAWDDSWYCVGMTAEYNPGELPCGVMRTARSYAVVLLLHVSAEASHEGSIAP